MERRRPKDKSFQFAQTLGTMREGDVVDVYIKGPQDSSLRKRTISRVLVMRVDESTQRDNPIVTLRSLRVGIAEPTFRLAGGTAAVKYRPAKDSWDL